MYNYNFQSGDVLLFKDSFKFYNPMSYLSLAIRQFSHSRFSHAAIVVNNWNCLFVNESTQKGVHSSPLLQRLKNEKFVVLRLKEMPIEFQFWEKSICRKANIELGKNYNFLDLLLVQPIYQLTGEWVGDKEKDGTKSLYCSEYVAKVYEFENWEEYTPEDLFQKDCLKEVYRNF